MCYAVVKIVYFKVRINNRSSIFLVYFVKWISTLTSWILNITRKIKCCRNILKERAPVTCMIWLTFALIYCYKWPWGYLTSIWFSCLYSMKNKKKKPKTNIETNFYEWTYGSKVLVNYSNVRYINKFFSNNDTDNTDRVLIVFLIVWDEQFFNS